MLKLNSVRPQIKHYLEEVFFMNGELIQNDLRLLEMILAKAENLEEITKEESKYVADFSGRLMFGEKCHLNTIYRAFYLKGSLDPLPYLNAINSLMNTLSSRNQLESKKLVSYLESLHDTYQGNGQSSCLIQLEVLTLISQVVSSEEEFKRLEFQLEDLVSHLHIERDRVWQVFEYENTGLISLSLEILQAFRELTSPGTSN